MNPNINFTRSHKTKFSPSTYRILKVTGSADWIWIFDLKGGETSNSQTTTRN